MFLRRTISIFALAAGSLLGVASAHAKVFYVSGTSTRTAGGTSCSNALSTAWFSAASTWGTASNQISAGTTIYLCGTFNGSAGEELLTVRGSGTASSPITIRFMPGAILSAPYWSGNGAIHMDNVSHIIVDGAPSGIIQNTANGTGRAYHQNSIAIHAANCTSCTVQNLTIQNLYVRTSATDTAATHSVNCVYWHSSNSFTVNHINCHDAVWAVAGDGNNFTLEYSEIYHVDHGVASGPVAKAGGYSIHNNHFHDFANWDSPTNAYHHDGIHLWGQNGGTVTSGAIYNNTFDGDFGVNITAHVFLQDSIQHVAVYNNTCVAPSNRSLNSIWIGARSTSMPGGPATGNSAYNNAINAGGHRTGTGIYVDNELQFTAVNNVLAGGLADISIQNGTTLAGAGINNNVYRNLFADFGDLNTYGWKGSGYYVFSRWQSICHCDGASKTLTGSQTTAFAAKAVVDTTSASPDALNLTVVSSQPSEDPELATLSTAGEGNGINLSELAVDGLAALAFDKNGVARPTSGPWNVGPQ